MEEKHALNLISYNINSYPIFTAVLLHLNVK